MTAHQAAILALLPEGAQVTADEVTAGADGIARSTVRNHLAALCDAGYVLRRKRVVLQHSTTHYAITAAGLQARRGAA